MTSTCPNEPTTTIGASRSQHVPSATPNRSRAQQRRSRIESFLGCAALLSASSDRQACTHNRYGVAGNATALQLPVAVRLAYVPLTTTLNGITVPTRAHACHLNQLPAGPAQSTSRADADSSSDPRLAPRATGTTRPRDALAAADSNRQSRSRLRGRV